MQTLDHFAEQPDIGVDQARVEGIGERLDEVAAARKPVLRWRPEQKKSGAAG